MNNLPISAWQTIISNVMVIELVFLVKAINNKKISLITKHFALVKDGVSNTVVLSFRPHEYAVAGSLITHYFHTFTESLKCSWNTHYTL